MFRFSRHAMAWRGAIVARHGQAGPKHGLGSLRIWGQVRSIQASRGRAGRGTAWQGLARRGEANHGLGSLRIWASPESAASLAGLGTAWRGETRPGTAKHGPWESADLATSPQHPTARPGLRLAWQGPARHGPARQGKATRGLGSLRIWRQVRSIRGLARPSWAWRGKAGLDETWPWCLPIGLESWSAATKKLTEKHHE